MHPGGLVNDIRLTHKTLQTFNVILQAAKKVIETMIDLLLTETQCTTETAIRLSCQITVTVAISCHCEGIHGIEYRHCHNVEGAIEQVHDNSDCHGMLCPSVCLKYPP